jgi:hypothetical protein
MREQKGADEFTPVEWGHLHVALGSAISRIEALQPSSAADAKPVAFMIYHDEFGRNLDFYDIVDGDRRSGYSSKPLYAQPHPSQQAGTDLLAEFGKHPGWELSSGYDEDDAFWQVHRINGGVNDREWTLIGKGDTPSDAILAALKTVEAG